MEPAEPPVDPRNHPKYDEIYSRIIREHFPKASADSAFVRGVVKRFRQAPMTICSRAIGAWINRQLRRQNRTQQDLAERLGVDRSAVAYWIQGGNITFPNFIQLLLEFETPWAEAPVPARRELALGAYVAALSYIRDKIDPDWDGRALDRERFWSLFHLFSEPHWERALRMQDPDMLRKEARRVAEAVAASLAPAPCNVTTVDALRQLVRDWGPAWLFCLWQIPHGWALR